jgi:hypothetical protein
VLCKRERERERERKREGERERNSPADVGTELCVLRTGLLLSSFVLT